MMSWPATFALLIGLMCVAGVTIALLDLGSVAAFLISGLGIVLVKVISKRPEFEGLPAPPAK